LVSELDALTIARGIAAGEAEAEAARAEELENLICATQEREEELGSSLDGARAEVILQIAICLFT